jgi:hypothetical protein
MLNAKSFAMKKLQFKLQISAISNEGIKATDLFSTLAISINRTCRMIKVILGPMIDYSITTRAESRNCSASNSSILFVV